MNKQWESERSRIEHAADARITFTIALHGEHAWENGAGRQRPLPQHQPWVGNRKSARLGRSHRAPIASALRQWSFGVRDKGPHV
jgi:hypothetical protein